MIGFWEILVILVILLIILGPKKLPELSRAIGEAVKEYRKALQEEEPKTKKRKRVKKPAG